MQKNLKEPKPTPNSPLAQEASPSSLTRNQKKKRRYKLSKLHKKLAAEDQNEEDQHINKRLKSETQSEEDYPTQNTSAASIMANTTTEQIDYQAQISFLSTDNITAQSNYNNNVGATSMCRHDLTHTAMLISTHFATNTATPFRIPAIPEEESAASADKHDIDHNESEIYEHTSIPTNNIPTQTIPTKTAAFNSAAPAFTRPPAAAPALAHVAPLGKNGQRVYLYGNYHRYYGYRMMGQKTFTQDPRLSILEKSWFHKKRCMDIGCNEGLVTLDIAMRFGTRSMIGVDIDEHLIKRACSHLRTERSNAATAAAVARRAGTSPAAAGTGTGEDGTAGTGTGTGTGEGGTARTPPTERRSLRTALSSLAQTWFVHADFLSARAEAGSVDVVTALSVTKWIHLHNGDEGMRAFFSKVHTVLSPGGLFIVEPQPWKSYKAAIGKIKKHIDEDVELPPGSQVHKLEHLSMRPENFVTLLCDEFGFRFVRRLKMPTETAAGFDRPLYLLRKKS